MTDYRRHRVPGGAYFFTVNLQDRAGDLLVRHIELLRACVRAEQARTPFSVLAFVALPDHLHTVWRLPEGDADFSDRWRRIKAGFSRALPRQAPISASQARKGERAVWQRRFWEHAIRDEDDLHRHIDYVHINPLKHGWVRRVADWPHSTFHAYVARGVYPADWAGGESEGEFGERRRERGE